MRRYVLPIALLLGGCASTPAVQVRTVTVDKPVAVLCVDPAKVPAEPPKVGSQLTGDAVHDADILGASNLRLRAWGTELVALIQPCTK